MNVKNVTPELINEALEAVKDNNRNIAYNLHELQNELDLKIEMRAVRQKRKYSFNITYCIKKPKRILFTVKTHTTGEFAVKANLFHIDNYREDVEKSPTVIKEKILSAETCEKCNPVCYNKKCSYIIDNTLYDPCYIKAHRFENLEFSEWQYLKGLIIKEYNANIK